MIKEKVIIGRVVRPQGIRGHVKAEPLADDAALFLEIEEVYVGAEARARAVLEARADAKGVYLALEGVSSRDAAEALRGAALSVPRGALSLPEGRYLIEELKGLEVRTGEGAPLGTLEDVLQHGAADVYVVGGARPFQFPALKRVIAHVDIEGGVMTLNARALSEVAVYDDED